MSNRQCKEMDDAVHLYLTAQPPIGIRTAAKRAGVSPSGLGYALQRARRIATNSLTPRKERK